MPPAASEGLCHLCGQTKRLTYEHFPPRRAFNDRPIYLRMIRNALLQGAGNHTPFRKGLGRCIFCEGCNGWLDRRYGSAFADWTIQAHTYLDRIGRERQVYVPFSVKPLNVIKRVSAMILAVADTANIDTSCYRELRAFVQNPVQKHVPPAFQVFVYLTNGPPLLCGQAIAVDTRTGLQASVIGEIAVPPVGYCVLQNDSESIVRACDAHLCPINVWGEAEFEELRCLWIKLAQLRPGGTYPLDYR